MSDIHTGPAARSTRHRTPRRNALALAIGGLSALLAAQAQAQGTDTVIVTGTRAVGTKATQSMSPIAVVTSDELAKTGQASVLDALLRVEPAFSVNAKGGDLSNIVRAATLRGLSANQTLVLVNGKRRNTTAMIATGGGQFGGANGVDLDLIPASAVARIEILKDGAAAQYGSDAIAGVMNIILKTSTDGSIEASWGRFADSKVNPNGLGNGRTRGLVLDKGIALGEDGYVHLSGEFRDHLNTNQTGPELRPVNTNPAKYGGPFDVYEPNTQGDPAYTLYNVAYNAGYNLTPDLELYSYSTFSSRNAFSWQNNRPLQVARASPCFAVPGTSILVPSTLPGGSTAAVDCTKVNPTLDVGGLAKAYYPGGFFIPKETIKERNLAAAAGAKGTVFGDARWDLSVNYGKDIVDIGVVNSLNYAYLVVPITAGVVGGPNGVSPTSAFIGQYNNSMFLVNFDIAKSFEIGLAAPLDVAVGVEARKDTYQVMQGDVASWSNGGLQSFVGMTPTDAGSYNRNEKGGYVDLNTSLATDWQVGLAVRTERYSDFGSTTNSKVSTRYDFSKQFAIRGTASTGFRAPTLAEQYFTTTTVGPTSANVIVPPGSPSAALLGGQALKPETSKNISLGFTITPNRDWRFTADFYSIAIKDRITNVSFSSTTSAALDAAVTKAIDTRGVIIPATAAGPTGTRSVQFAANRIDLTTKGVDLTAGTNTDLGTYGKIDWNVSGTFRKISIDKADTTLFTPAALWSLTDTPPKNKFVASADWTMGPWKSTLRVTRYGESSTLALPSNASFLTYANVRPELELQNGYIKSTVKAAFITDAEVSYDVTKKLRVVGGINNLTNKTPERQPDLVVNGDPKVSASSVTNSTGVGVYSTISPYGINGAYYYLKAGYKF
jgi:iron complex outermembrane receptor protein